MVAAMAFPLLNISPSQLEFLFEADRELKSTLNLRNVNEGVRVAFKIKVRAPSARGDGRDEEMSLYRARQTGPASDLGLIDASGRHARGATACRWRIREQGAGGSHAVSASSTRPPRAARPGRDAIVGVPRPRLPCLPVSGLPAPFVRCQNIRSSLVPAFYAAAPRPALRTRGLDRGMIL